MEEVISPRAVFPPVSIESWRARGKNLSTHDGEVWWLDTLHDPRRADTGSLQGSPATPVCILHGFPTASHDFAHLIELAAPRRIIALDFLGFGLSDKPVEFGYSMFEHADAVTAVLREAKVERVHILAHDMGTTVATELCARRERGLLPFEMASLTLMNGSVHIELSELTFGQIALRSPFAKIFAKLNTARTFKAQMKRIFGRPVSEDELDAMWALIARADGPLRLPQTIRYIEERSRFRRRWIGALERLDIPALIAWGRLDPVAVVAIARKLASEIPNADLTIWDDLGHYPQVEAPDVVAKTVVPFWDRVDAPR